MPYVLHNIINKYEIMGIKTIIKIYTTDYWSSYDKRNRECYIIIDIVTDTDTGIAVPCVVVSQSQ